jgi:hypothetical protein
MNETRPVNERRKWIRLPLAIPVFVRSRDDKGKDFLEFATALNVSAGGMLVALRRVLPAIAQVRLEIPSAPVAALALLPRSSRILRAKALRTTPAEGYYLLGLKFARPLLIPAPSTVRRRKVASLVWKGLHIPRLTVLPLALSLDDQSLLSQLFGKLVQFNYIS